MKNEKLNALVYAGGVVAGVGAAVAVAGFAGGAAVAVAGFAAGKRAGLFTGLTLVGAMLGSGLVSYSLSSRLEQEVQEARRASECPIESKNIKGNIISSKLVRMGQITGERMGQIMVIQ